MIVIRFINLLLLLSILSSFTQEQTEELNEANKSYQEGKEASTIWQRKKAFNQALNLYLKLKSTIPPPNYYSSIDEAIANSYFQLNEYAWAILYYYKALEIDPRNKTIQQQLLLTQEKLGLPPQLNIPFLQRILSLNGYLPLSWRLQLFLCLGVLTLILLSFNLYQFQKAPINGNRTALFTIKKLTKMSLVFTSLFLLNLLISWYLIPIEGVLITPTNLVELSNKQTSTSLLEGIKVQIIGIEEQGYWVKIKVEKEKVGYVPAHSIRMI